jgi:hypothetical protein
MPARRSAAPQSQLLWRPRRAGGCSPRVEKAQEPKRRPAPPYLACFPASAPVPHAIEPVPGLPSPLWAA